jgi:hypothetical protein
MKRRPLFIASGIIAIAAAIAAAGCGGGTPSSGVAPITAAAATTGQATLSIVIPPASSTSSSSRGTEYVSPSTGSVSFQLPSMTTATVVAVGPGVSGCTGSAGTGYTCTATFSAPLGTGQVLTVKTYASSTGTGSVLAQGTTTIDVTATGPNSASVTLNGVVASIALSSSAGTTVTVGTPGTTTITWSAKDASGNTIIAPGTLVDAGGTALATPVPTISPSADSSAFSIGSYSGTATGGSWVGTYNGTAATSPLVITASVTNSGVTAGTLSITVNPAPTASPSASPTATSPPTASPTASPTAANAILNGSFATDDLTDWYICYAEHTKLPAGGVNPSPSPNPVQSAQAATPGPASTPKTGSYTPLQSGLGNQYADASVQTTTPNGSTNGYANMALVGHSDYPFNSGKAIGVCQNITVPAGSPTLTFGVYEGGNDNFVNSDSEADIFPSGSFSTAANGGTATTLAFTTLFAEDNCYNNLSAYGSDAEVASSTNGSARAALCGTGGDSTLVGNGGQWYQRSFDMSSFAGQNVTLFLGIWRNAGSGTALGTTEYYSYAYYGNVTLH